MNISALTDVGLVRDNNEDSFYKSKDCNFPLFIVADGMGGHKAGETASKMAVEIIKNNFIQNKSKLTTEKSITKHITQAIKIANKEIFNYSNKDKLCSGMGTTITLAYILNEKIYIGHVGDSRAYRIRDNDIIQLTEDHSLVHELVKSGSITIEEGKVHPQRNMITRAVGTSTEIEVDLITEEFLKDDIFIICSDGLTNMITDQEIKKSFKNKVLLNEACIDLVNKAKDNGGKDNITIIAIELVN